MLGKRSTKFFFLVRPSRHRQRPLWPPVTSSDGANVEPLGLEETGCSDEAEANVFDSRRGHRLALYCPNVYLCVDWLASLVHYVSQSRQLLVPKELSVLPLPSPSPRKSKNEGCNPRRRRRRDIRARSSRLCCCSSSFFLSLRGGDARDSCSILVCLSLYFITF